VHLTAAVIELMTRAIGRIYIIPNDSVQGVIPHSNTHSAYRNTRMRYKKSVHFKIECEGAWISLLE